MISSLDHWDSSLEDFGVGAKASHKSDMYQYQQFFGSERDMLPEGADLEPLSINMPSLLSELSAGLSFPTHQEPSSSNSSKKTSISTDELINSMLHRTCQQFATDRFVIKTALDLDPSAARYSSSIPASAITSSQKGGALNSFVAFPTRRKGLPKEPFQLPLNIALANGASSDVLALLVEAAPEVVGVQDGSNGLTSLSLALTKRPRDRTVIVSILLAANPEAVLVADKRQNLPLHIACQKGASLDVVQSLYMVFPQALHRRNFHGETPLQIAQRNSKCSEDVLNFLYRRR